MPRTPDRFPGSREDEELILEEQVTDPTAVGAVRNVSGTIKARDSVGVFNLRSASSLNPTFKGQVPFTLDGSTVTMEQPLTSRHGWLIQNDGIQLVVG